VPETLVTKIYQPRSLSRSWDFGARSWTAVTRSAMRAVARAELTGSERLLLWSDLAAFAAGQVVRAGRRGVTRAVRRARGRRPAAIARDERETAASRR
jgi:hypothetical protein